MTTYTPEEYRETAVWAEEQGWPILAAMQRGLAEGRAPWQSFLAYGGGGVVGTRARELRALPGSGENDCNPQVDQSALITVRAARTIGTPSTVGSNPTRRLPKLTASSLPPAPGFWQGLAAERDATVRYEPEAPHGHYRRKVEWLAHPGNCPDGSCLRRKVRWMAAQPESSHAGRNGRRLMQVYGL